MPLAAVRSRQAGSQEPSLIGYAQTDTGLVVVWLDKERAVAAQTVVIRTLECAAGIFTLHDNLLDGMIVETECHDIRRTIAILLTVCA